MAHKKSIRFFNDRQVRAVWDDGHSKWWFSAIDIVRAINDEEDYVKAGNYWRWLKKFRFRDTYIPAHSPCLGHQTPDF